MRKVKLMNARWNPETRTLETVPTDKEGYFHQWGMDFEELPDTGVGNYTTAIVELEDGTIITPPADMIQFVSLGHKTPKAGAENKRVIDNIHKIAGQKQES